MSKVSVFQNLLSKVNEQFSPQRLLFLFASAEATRKSGKSKEKSGTITPTMVVDKLPEDLCDFESLVSEADGISKDWDLVFIAALSGDSDGAPSSDEAEMYLNKMSNDIASGQNIHRYVVLDRNENPIEIMPH